VGQWNIHRVLLSNNHRFSIHLLNTIIMFDAKGNTCILHVCSGMERLIEAQKQPDNMMPLPLTPGPLIDWTVVGSSNINFNLTINLHLLIH
jgi:hypothetical protein